MPKTYRSTGESLNHTVSNLSVDAVAFVPSVLQHQQQSRIQNNYSQKLPHQEQQQTYGSSGHYSHSQLQHQQQQHHPNPGQFDAIATRFLTIFEGMENNTFVLSNAMEDIFNESIKNPNFRYMGAKLYNLLHMLNPRKDSLFHTLLKCKLDFHQNEVKEYIKTNQQNKVRETALFLAELYMQLRGEEFRIHLIAENIVYSLKQLLSKENADNVRCICLTLKLAGYDLTADCPDDMKEIIVELNAINNRSPGKYPLAANVISLEKNNWGRKISGSESPIEGNKLMEPPRSSDDPVFYGPDGSVITDEECEFLTTSANGIPGSTDNDEIDNDSDVDLDPEMDEETEHAYKEFIRQSANS
uniref:MIF4G domain-containing protein n=1 Tax=Glossina pallidipes TaxID=7398 RepID=A0A1A9ZNT0_GLOPL